MLAPKTPPTNKKILHELVPLNALSAARFDEIAEKITIEVVKSGRYLFRKGDRDNRAIYLLEGKVALQDGFRKVSSELEAGSEECRHPLASQQPRAVSARVVEKAVIAWVDAGLLDAFLAWDQSNCAETVNYGVEDSGDWMSRLLQSETFNKLPPATLQALLMKMEPLEVEQGEVIVNQGDEGDYFYMIHEGRCVVTRHEQPGGSETELATLQGGDAFGEEALVSDDRRNATIRMLTPGLLMRLAKEDFDGLLKTQLIRAVAYDEARQLVESGAVWLDVRTEDEYAGGAFEDSVNLPLASVRGELPELIFHATYIVCCSTGSRSDSAAVILRHKGYDVCVLKDGIASVPETALVASQEAATVAPAASACVDNVTAMPLDDGMQSKFAALQQSNLDLSVEVERLQAERGQLLAQVEQLRGELGESTERLGELYERIKAEVADKSKLHEQYQARMQEYENELALVAAQAQQPAGAAQPDEQAQLHLAELETALQRSHDIAVSSARHFDQVHKQLLEQYAAARTALQQCDTGSHTRK